LSFVFPHAIGVSFWVIPLSWLWQLWQSHFNAFSLQ